MSLNVRYNYFAMEINNVLEIEAIYIGKHARKFLTVGQEYSVWGNTSKGVFLKGSTDKILFISYDQNKGPLTINLKGDGQTTLIDISVGSKAFYNTEIGLDFIDDQLNVDLRNAAIWQPENFQEESIPSKLKQNLEKLARFLVEFSDARSFCSIVSKLVINSKNTQSLDNNLAGNIFDLYTAMYEKNGEQFKKSASSLIGFGAGLTPSGDDFLTGMALVTARYSVCCPELRDYHTWFESLVTDFQLQTTSLSSCLFLSALDGSADERIIDAFDLVMGETVNITEVIGKISTWGSSSGYDTLAGLMLLMKVITK